MGAERRITGPLDKALIRSLIPHAGSMCLLDAVTAWDADSILCETVSHRDPANPLRRQGRLAALHACEYGAQAAAIHGALCARAAGQTPPPAYLAALRDVRWCRADLAEIAAPLLVTARRLLGENSPCVYAIQVQAAGQLLVEARITIASQPAPGQHP